MTVPQHTLDVVRGDDFAGPVVRWLDGDREPVPILSARLHVRRLVSDTEPLLTLNDGEGLTIGGADLNEVSIALTAAQTAGLTEGVWDLEGVTQVFTANGLVPRVKTLLGGRVSVEKDVTR